MNVVLDPAATSAEAGLTERAIGCGGPAQPAMPKMSQRAASAIRFSHTIAAWRTDAELRTSVRAGTESPICRERENDYRSQVMEGNFSVTERCSRYQRVQRLGA